MYAVVEVGGKQYIVENGQTLEVDRLEAASGSSIKLDKVLFAADADKFLIGKPYLEGAYVEAVVENHFLGKKVVAYKYRRRKAYHRKKGFRAQLTRLKIMQIKY